MIVSAFKRGLLRTPFGPALRASVVRLGLPAPERDPPPFGPPYRVVGHLAAPTGLGEAARLSLAALRELGVDVGAADLGAPLPPMEGPGTLVLYVNAPETPAALRKLGATRLAGKRVVGFWHWELPHLPPIWRRYGEDVHEVLAPSRFVAEAVRAGTAKPVRLVPHPVRLPNVAPLDRGAFGLHRSEFVALTVFNLDSGFHRKNALGAVEAFAAAFGQTPGARLVLKTRAVAGHAREKAALRRAAAGAANVTWLEHTMSAADLAALTRACDVVLSLHRSEGFGLVPAQAMLLGRPVIATNWSSTTDFLTRANAALVGYDLVPVADPYGIYTQRGEVWAEPRLAEAADWLARLAKDTPLRLRLGAQARLDADRIFSVDAFGRAWRGDA